VTSERVVVSDEQDLVEVETARWSALATGALEALGVSGELTLTFVDVDEMAALNHQFMDASGPTDVLAFPIDQPPCIDDPSATDAEQLPVLLGDVVICPAVALEQAPDHAGDLDDELALLVVHGILHIVGHDHATEHQSGAMRDLERSLLEQLHWRGPVPSGFSFDHR
jgi:probable rRNA maturation factor